MLILWEWHINNYYAMIFLGFLKYLSNFSWAFEITPRDGGQNLERRNVEQPILQNFQIANIEITKDELSDSFIIQFTFFICYKLFEQPKYLIILSNCEILIFQTVK